MLITNLLKNLQKHVPLKSYKQINLMNMSKSGKSAHFHYIFVKGAQA